MAHGRSSEPAYRYFHGLFGCGRTFNFMQFELKEQKSGAKAISRVKVVPTGISQI